MDTRDTVKYFFSFFFFFVPLFFACRIQHHHEPHLHKNCDTISHRKVIKSEKGTILLDLTLLASRSSTNNQVSQYTKHVNESKLSSRPKLSWHSPSNHRELHQRCFWNYDVRFLILCVMGKGRILYRWVSCNYPLCELWVSIFRSSDRIGLGMYGNKRQAFDT